MVHLAYRHTIDKSRVPELGYAVEPQRCSTTPIEGNGQDMCPSYFRDIFLPSQVPKQVQTNETLCQPKIVETMFGHPPAPGLSGTDSWLVE